MKKVLILGSVNNVDFSGYLGKNILHFLNSYDEKIVVDNLPETYEELIEKIKSNKYSLILFCPTKIPSKIFKKMSQEISNTRSLLFENSCTVGYLKLNRDKVEEICFSFNKHGFIDKKFFPRKKKEAYCRPGHNRRAS